MKLRILTTAVLMASFVAAQYGLAQDARRTDLGRSAPCPYPAKMIIHGHDPGTILSTELPPVVAAAVAGSVFRQSHPNHFGYTFTFPVCPKECCAWTTAYLKVTFKALGTSQSFNDSAAIYVNGASVVPPQSIWPESVIANTVKTSTFVVPGSALAHGHLSLIVEQNTAVMASDLTLEGCCLCGKHAE